MRIGFFASQCLPVHAETLNERPLGGTETGLIRLSAALKNRGHEVTVFTSHPHPPESNPLYKNLKDIEAGHVFDVFVTVRDWIPLFYKVTAKQKWIWSGDASNEFVTYGLGDLRIQNQMTGLLAVSEWQKKMLCGSSGLSEKKVKILRNGIHLPFFKQATDLPRSQRLIYTSTPHRGLKHLPGIFKKIKRCFPKAELHIYSSFKVYDQDRDQEFKPLFDELSFIEGIKLFGSVKQDDLAQALMQSSIWLYPTDFDETSCIAAMEAMAAGAIPVASNRAGLAETVSSHGILINGDPAESSYQNQIVKSVEELWNNEAALQKRRVLLIENASQYSWDSRAVDFEKLVSSLI